MRLYNFPTVQWGYATATQIPSTQTITFPFIFPSVVFSIIQTPRDTTTQRQLNDNIQSYTNANFVFAQNSVDNFWVAMGV